MVGLGIFNPSSGGSGGAGVDGVDGKTVLTTTGVPAVGVGVAGDYAYDPATQTMYGPKTTTWPAGVVLKGTDGVNGDPGTTLPTQATHDGEFLTTDGSDLSWGTPAGGGGGGPAFGNIPIGMYVLPYGSGYGYGIGNWSTMASHSGGYGYGYAFYVPEDMTFDQYTLLGGADNSTNVYSYIHAMSDAANSGGIGTQLYALGAANPPAYGNAAITINITLPAGWYRMLIACDNNWYCRAFTANGGTEIFGGNADAGNPQPMFISTTVQGSTSAAMNTNPAVYNAYANNGGVAIFGLRRSA